MPTRTRPSFDVPVPSRSAPASADAPLRSPAQLARQSRVLQLPYLPLQQRVLGILPPCADEGSLRAPFAGDTPRETLRGELRGDDGRGNRHPPIAQSGEAVPSHRNGLGSASTTRPLLCRA